MPAHDAAFRSGEEEGSCNRRGPAALCAGGVLAGIVTLWQKSAFQVWVHINPLILVAVFLFTLGVNLFLMGLLAEIIIRTYHESQGKPIYWVRELRNFEE